MKQKQSIAMSLVLAFLLVSTIAAWSRDKGYPSTDVVAENMNKKCDAKSGRTGLNPKIFVTPASAFTLLPSWELAESGFESLLPSIKANPKQTLVFHLTTWNLLEDDTSLNSSSWYVYHYNGAKMKQSYRVTATENIPFLYADASIMLVSVQRLETVTENAPNRIVKASYNLAIKQKTPQNIANLIAVGEALLGVTGGAKAEALAKEAPIPVCVETFNIRGAHPPYDLTAEASFEFLDPSKSNGEPSEGDVSPNQSGPSNQPQSMMIESSSPAPPLVTTPKKNPSALSRTFTVLDKEYWDVNLGLNIPSVNQPVFTLSKDNKVQESISKKVSPYAFMSLYPFAAISPKDGAWPHINLGVPVAGQPLHRPFGGIAEKLPWLDRYTGIPISIFAGAVALKESISTLPLGPTTTPDQFALRSHWVWKGMFGLEFPVSSLIGKIGKK